MQYEITIAKLRDELAENFEKDGIIAEMQKTIAELRDELDGLKKKSSDENSETTTYGPEANHADMKKPKKKYNYKAKPKGGGSAATEAA